MTRHLEKEDAMPSTTNVFSSGNLNFPCTFGELPTRGGPQMEAFPFWEIVLRICGSILKRSEVETARIDATWRNLNYSAESEYRVE